MKRKLDKFAIFGALLGLIMIGSTSGVMALAYGPNGNAPGPATNPSTNVAPTQQTSTSGAAHNAGTQAAQAGTQVAQNNKTQAAQTRAAQQAQAKLRICSERQAAVTRIMSNITTRVNNQLKLFGQIATNVENFYNSSNSKQTLTNYTQLVQDVNQAKLQALNDEVTLSSNDSFSCSLAHPRAMVTTFQGYLKTEIKDLQNYRVSVKNLIVAVAKANGLTIKNSGN